MAGDFLSPTQAARLDEAFRRRNSLRGAPRYQPMPAGPATPVVPAAPATAAVHAAGSAKPRLLTLPTPPFAVRVLNNLGYGATTASVAEFNALGGDDATRLAKYVDAQLNWQSIDDSAVQTRLANAGYTTLGKSLTQLWADHVLPNPDWDTRMRPAWEVQRAAFVRATYSRRQLCEVMANFWHDHFNVYVGDYSAGPVYPHYDRDVIRANAFGNFRKMLEAVAQSTSMLYYLDNVDNSRAGPNENYARELMELHTFGAENYLGFMNPFEVPPCPEDPTYPIGYTDNDVYEVAAAFTGWTVKNGNWEYPTENDGTFVYRSGWHDTGPKYPLGMYLYPEQAALKDGRDILDRIASHPRVAKFICKKLARRFFADDPPQSLVDGAAKVFRQNWQAPDQIRTVLRYILLSDTAYTAWGEKNRRPFETVVAAMRTLGSDWTLRVGNDASNSFMWLMGMTGNEPYAWPAPNGYPDTGVAWSGSNSFAMTWRFLNGMGESVDGSTQVVPILAATRSGLPVAQWTATKLVDYWCQRILGYKPVSARRQSLINFMAQNGDPTTYVIADDDIWSVNDLKRHYNQQRLRSMVSLILMTPEFLSR